MKIILGTAQLGLNYGITNQYGKPSLEKSLRIIKTALYNNITEFDTARAYGDSETVLGIARETFGEMNIITKLDPLKNLDKMSTIKEIHELVDNSIKTSLKNLKLHKLNTLLLHRVNHYNNKVVWNYLLDKKKEKKIEKLGVSVYSVNEAIIALKDKNIQHIQLPINILDEQWFCNDFLELINKRTDVIVHCRSIFLQGILLSSKDKWPKLENINADEYVENLNMLVKKFGFKNKIELCLSYVKSIEWIDGLLMGVDTVDQLNENIKLFKVRKLTNNEFKTVREIFKNVSTILLNPSLW